MSAGMHHDQDLGWLLDGFVQRIAGASSAVVVTADGLVLAASGRIGRDTADQLGAVTSGLAGLTASAAQCLTAGPVHQVIIEMAGGYLFVTSVSTGSALAVMCDPDCDIGLVGYEMSALVDRIGQALTPALRAGSPPPVP